MDRHNSLGVMASRDLAPELLVPFARRAEDVGFDELWVVEDLGFRGGIAQAATALAATMSIRVGVGILPVGARHVAYAAMELSTLGELFPGRLVAGLGHGMPEWMRSIGAWPRSPLTLLEEYFTTLRALLAGEPAPANGRYVLAEGLKLECPPLLPPPLMAGVRGPRSLAAAGRFADGVVLAEPATPEYVRQAVDRVGGQPSVVAYNVAAVHPDETEARRMAREGLAWIGEPDWRPHIEPLEFCDDFYALRASAESPHAFARTLPDEWVDRLAVTGSPDSAKQRLAALFEAGATSAVLIPSGTDPMSALDGLALLAEPHDLAIPHTREPT